MRVRARSRVVAIAATTWAIIALALTGAALAGSFAYTLVDVAPDTAASRQVDHDYSLIQGYVSSTITTCVQRNSGNIYCASGTASHSYGDSCNPSACRAYYRQYASINKDIQAYDEWR